MSITLNGTTGIVDADGGNVLSSADIATLAEAQAGTDASKIMSPLRAAQAISALGGLGGINIQSFTTSGTYTPTAGYKYAIAIVTGGGAGGSSSATFGSGGPAGGTVIGSFSLSSIGTPTITVGAGGGAGAAGGTSSIGTTLSAYGGYQTVAYTGLVQIQGGDGGVGFQYQAGAGRGGQGGGSFWGGGGAISSGSGLAYGSGGGGAYNGTGGSGKSGIVMIMEFK